MSASEPARHALYSRLQHVLGPDHADTLMTYLPHDRSDEVATKGDVGRLEDRFEERFVRLEDRFDRLEEGIDARFEHLTDRMDRMQRFYVATTVGSMAALTAAFSLVVSVFG